jgi:hypothetical protein
VCRFSLSFGDVVGGRQYEVQALNAGIHAGARRWCSVSKKFFTSRAVITFMTSSCMLSLKCFASAKMFTFV